MDDWKRSFLERLHEAQAACLRRFGRALDEAVVPVFEELSEFLQDNGFRALTPLREQDRRSFKFELAENAYVLLIFRFSGVDEFELRSETFVPGRQPILERSVSRLADIDGDWARQRFQQGLDRFVELLAARSSESAEPQGAAV